MVNDMPTETKDSAHVVEDHLMTQACREVTSCSCPDSWTWNWKDRSPEADISSDCVKDVRGTNIDGLHRTVIFHPNWSNGSAAIRATRPLNAFTVHYWEVFVSRRLFGTSLQFGVATKTARLDADSFINLLGEDEHSWALSHKGSLWHNGRCSSFVEPFDENESVTVGLLFDGPRGTLTYFKDGICLGVGFSGLTTGPLGPDLYPAISSTAAKTEMTLIRALRNFNSLQDRCRATIIGHLTNGVGTVEKLPVPNSMKNYIRELIHVADAEHECRRPEIKRIVLSQRKSTEKIRRSPRRSLKDWPTETQAILYG